MVDFIKEEQVRMFLQSLDINELWHFADGYFNNDKVKQIITNELSVPLQGKYIIGEMIRRNIWDRFRKSHAHIFYPLCPSCYQKYV